MDSLLKIKKSKGPNPGCLALENLSLKLLGVLPQQSLQDQAQDVANHVLAGMNDFLL